MKYFVSGTDTNIGKTVAVAWLAKKFASEGRKVVTQKLIQTGCEGISEDILAHRKITGSGLLPEDENRTTCRYVLKFPERLLPDFVKEKLVGRSAFYLEARKAARLFSELDELYETFSESREELYLLFSNRVAEIVLTLCRSVPQSKPFVADNKITPILQYINDRLTVPISIEDLCRKFYFSQSYICKEFRTYMKVSIMKYIRSKKIMAAHQSILKGLKPTKVAEMYGYSDYSTFYRTYLSVMGFPPSGNKNGDD